MGRRKVSHKYVTLKVPDGLADKIDELIKLSEGDFTSRTDVVKYAVRLLYREKMELHGKDDEEE